MLLLAPWIVSLSLNVAPPSPQGFAPAEPPAGDANKIQWVFPFEEALERSRATGRPLFVKPIIGGSNRPDPDGVPCGGKSDCEGSW